MAADADTEDKRRSAIGVEHVPDGTIAEGDRKQAAGEYRGPGAAGEPESGGLRNLRLLGVGK